MEDKLYKYIMKEIAPILEKIEFTEELHGEVYREIEDQYDKLATSDNSKK